MPALIFGGLAAAAGLASAGTAIGGAIHANQAAKKNAEMAQKMGQEQAGLLEGQAEQGQRVLGYQLGKFDRQAGRLAGAQDAAIASSGITSGGSASLMSADTINNLRTDRKNLYQTYQNRISELRQKAQYARENGATQSDIIQTQGTANMWSNIGNAAGTIGNMSSGIYNLGTNAGWWG